MVVDVPHQRSIISQIDIPEIPLETFLSLLEYLYTDHAPIEDGDSIGILQLANQYVQPRLMALCELYISKEVERATMASIAQADVDIIGECFGEWLVDNNGDKYCTG